MNKRKKRKGVNKNQQKKGKWQLCSHCKRKGHVEPNCWFRPNVRCKSCNQLGHAQSVCKNKAETQAKVQEPVDKADLAEKKSYSWCNLMM